MNKLFKILLGLLWAVPLWAQPCSFSISGYITDESTQKPLVNVHIFIEELQIGGFTNEMGFYEIHHICSGNYHIRISHIGCETLKVFLPVTETLTFSKVLHHHAELIDEIIIHGEKQNNTTQASQTIKKEEIVLKGNKNLADLLEEITGIQSIKNGSGISKPVIHGLTGNRIAIVNNGIVQSGQQWGNDHAPEIDPFVAHHISVIKGTGALAYSGGSLGGIVLIEPKELDNEPHLHGQTHYITESNGRGHTANLQLEKKSKGFSWRTLGTFKQSGDTHTPDYYLTNTGKKEINGAIQLESDFSKQWKSSLYYSLFTTENGILRGSHIGNSEDLQQAIRAPKPYFTQDDFSYSINAPKQKVSHHLLKWKNNYTFSDKISAEFVYANQINNRKEFDVRRSGRSDIPALSLLQTQHTIEGLFTFQLNDGKSIKTGIQNQLIDNSNNPETGILPLIPDYNSIQSGIFGIFQQQKNNWFFEYGTRYDFKHFNVVSISRENRNIERFNHQFHNLSFSGGIKHFTTEHIKNSLNIGWVSRSPEINELHSNGLHQGISGIEEGNKNLKQEHAFKIIGTTDIKINNHLFIQIAPYIQNINDYIYLQPENEFRNTIRGAFPVFSYQQTNARIIGNDVMIVYEPTENLKLNLRHAYIKGDDTQNKTPLIGIPAQKLFGSIAFRLSDKNHWKNSTATLNGQYVFKQNHLLITQDFLPPPPAYFLLGTQLTTQYQLNKSTLKWNLRVENMLNTTYRDYLNRLRYFSDEKGINFIMGVSYEF